MVKWDLKETTLECPGDKYLLAGKKAKIKNNPKKLLKTLETFLNTKKKTITSHYELAFCTVPVIKYKSNDYRNKDISVKEYTN